MTVTSQKPTKKRRSAEQRIADLEAEIAKVRQRETAKELRADPAVQEAAKLVRALNLAQGVADNAKDEALVAAVTTAREAVGGYLESRGIAVPKRRQPKTSNPDDPEQGRPMTIEHSASHNVR